MKLAERHAGTIVPNYTNGVAAQPNSLGHYLLGHAAGLDRDAQRIREAYVRIDRSAMGTTVLNGTSWPLNRTRMADYPVKGRGGLGVKTVQLTAARGQLAGAMPVREGFQVMLISNGGTVIRMPVDEIKRLGRSTQGVIVMRPRDGEKVSTLAPVIDTGDEADDDETPLDGEAPLDLETVSPEDEPELDED